MKADTEHTCGGPKFGRKTPGCPRCDELLAGSPARDRTATRTRESVGTRHTCCPPGRGPAFGRKTPGCPRCDELLAGAAPREAHAGHLAAQRRAQFEADTVRGIREHDCQTSGCGPICTAFQW
jgi:hypothetical protein